MRPARIAPAVAQQGHHQKSAERDLENPADLREELRHPVRQRLCLGGIRSFCHESV
ncbi:hypothetical protein MYA_0863 [Burkholderia sp. KJ006]|nr:hypothetical protein MYA_0863 [Burkholderia sp. KJ006]